MGTNARSRERNLSRALERLNAHRDIRISRISSLYKSAPWGLKEQPWFMNAVCEIDTHLSPLDLLRELKNMEKGLGRAISSVKWGPRKIDLDILLFHDAIIETAELQVPHKYLTERLFVLTPLLELDPEGIHPKTKISFKEYLERYSFEDRKKSCSLYIPKAKNTPLKWGKY